jgi:hypothetical protein
MFKEVIRSQSWSLQEWENGINVLIIRRRHRISLCSLSQEETMIKLSENPEEEPYQNPSFSYLDIIFLRLQNCDTFLLFKLLSLRHTVIAFPSD